MSTLFKYCSRVLFWTLLLGANLHAQSRAEEAAPWVACISDGAAPPFTYPDREGSAQALTRLAAQHLGQPLSFVREPRRRCIENVTQGKYQIMMVAAYVADFIERFAFPMRGNTPDGRCAVGHAISYVVSLPGSAVRWDGQNLSGVHQPLLMRVGRLTVRTWAIEHGFEFQEVRTQKQILEMLALGRAEAALMRDYEIQMLQKEFGDTYPLQVHPIAVSSADLFVVFDKEFAHAHRKQVEAFWSEIARIRASAEWKRLEPSFSE